MIIKKGSIWHRLYKLNAYFSFNPDLTYDRQTNLCHFMRCVSLWLSLKLVSAALFIAALATIPSLQIIVSTTVVVALILFGSVWLYVKWERNRPSLQQKREPSLIWQWIKAKKAKICPLVTLE